MIMSLMQTKAYTIPRNGPVVCRLWRMRGDPPLDETRAARVMYAVEMRGLGMRRMYCVGEDRDHAEWLFGMITRNTVTPCCLGEVLEDLAASGSREV
jgi:hypothetical protein